MDDELLPIFLICRLIEYELTDTELVITMVLLLKRIPLDDITDATRSWNPLSSPAMSLRRIHITTRCGMGVLISPKDRDEFMRDLAERVPHLQYVDGQVV
ncbi:MAG: PH domain-containing protein [Proteobacteria bacterium]|nr:PH domain-containing protein [Pseudomonadota bacterium]